MIRCSGAGVCGWVGTILLIFAIGIARGQANPPAATEPEELSAEDALTQKLLNKPIAQVNFSVNPFDQTIAYFGRQTKANYVVEWKSMKWLDPTTPISLSMKDVKVSNALAADLDQIGQDKIAYMIDRGVVTISAPDGLERLKQMKLDEDYSFADAADRQAMDRVLPTVVIPQVPLSEAVTFIGAVSGLKIQVQSDDLTAAGINPKEPVDCRVHDVKVSKVLDIFLRDAAPDKIEYVIDQGVVTISTPAALDSTLILREYDVKGLGQGMDSIKQQLRQRVQWGPKSAMDENGTIITVTQTRANQRAIADFIRQLQNTSPN